MQVALHSIIIAVSHTQALKLVLFTCTDSNSENAMNSQFLHLIVNVLIEPPITASKCVVVTAISAYVRNSGLSVCVSNHNLNGTIS